MAGFGYSAVLNCGARNGAFWFEAIGAVSSGAVARFGSVSAGMAARALISIPPRFPVALLRLAVTSRAGR